MKQVHIVMAHEIHGSIALQAFEEKADAERLQKACIDHYNAGPDHPGIDATQKVKQAYEERWQRWRCAHPGGAKALGYAEFTVETLSLMPKTC